jgi:hypothetical protein
MVAAIPHQGGATWAVLQYPLGCRQLGHQVYFVELIEETAMQLAGFPLVVSENATYREID